MRIQIPPETGQNKPARLSNKVVRDVDSDTLLAVMNHARLVTFLTGTSTVSVIAICAFTAKTNRILMRGGDEARPYTTF